jgi:predicted site-specific integrase-resolvase
MEMDLLKPEEAAEILRVSMPTLQRMRSGKYGPPFVRISKGVIRYNTTDLQRYIESQTQGGSKC